MGELIDLTSRSLIFLKNLRSWNSLFKYNEISFSGAHVENCCLKMIEYPSDQNSQSTIFERA